MISATTATPADVRTVRSTRKRVTHGIWTALLKGIMEAEVPVARLKACASSSYAVLGKEP